ncbi:MAG: phosphohistidine phosphatase [Bacteroidetes bacterium]|nr:MAG: phosphohistidine phosphatase [Bacteroidota bacterium]
MKLLFLVRHAKSEWANDTLSDIDRPLNARGYRDAQFMSELLDKRGYIPDLIVSSPAIRAVSTALIFARRFNYPVAKIQLNERLYEAAPSTYIDVVAGLPKDVQNAMIFGHNPTITAVAAELSGIPFENIATTGIVGVKFDSPSWGSAVEVGGGLEFYEFPKKHG